MHEALDLFRDSELKTHGILKEMLPSELGIYRISQHLPGSRAAPLSRLGPSGFPHHRRIIILALSPITPLTDNADHSISGAAAAQLRGEGRTWILANLTARQFKVFHHHDGERLLGPQNIAPDLEFAIAPSDCRIS